MADVTFRVSSREVKLDIVEVFEYYDGPILYSAMSQTEQYYLSVWADSGDDGDTWLFLPVSSERLRAVRTGAIGLYDAFRKSPEPWLYRVESGMHTEIPEATIVFIDDVPDEMLPEPGEFLELLDDARPGEVRMKVVDYAREANRHVVDIAMTRVDSGTLLGADELGRLLQGLQNIVYSEALPERIAGPIPSSTRETYELKVRGYFAASFGVRLESGPPDLFGQSANDFERVMESVATLLSSLTEPKGFFAYISEHRRTRVTLSRYREFLSYLRTADTNFALQWARPGRDVVTVVLKRNQINRAVEILKSSEEEAEPKILSVRGELDTISKRRNQFVFVGEDNEIFRGSLSREMAERRFTVPSKAIALIEEIVEIDELTGESQPVYTLMDIKPEEDVQLD